MGDLKHLIVEVIRARSISGKEVVLLQDRIVPRSFP